VLDAQDASEKQDPAAVKPNKEITYKACVVGWSNLLPPVNSSTMACK
jgi:hypothetical protein